MPRSRPPPIRGPHLLRHVKPVCLNSPRARRDQTASGAVRNVAHEITVALLVTRRELEQNPPLGAHYARDDLTRSPCHLAEPHDVPSALALLSAVSAHGHLHPTKPNARLCATAEGIDGSVSPRASTNGEASTTSRAAGSPHEASAARWVALGGSSTTATRLRCVRGMVSREETCARCSGRLKNLSLILHLYGATRRTLTSLTSFSHSARLCAMATRKSKKPTGRPRILDKATPVTFYLPQSTQAEIRDMAKERNCSCSQVVREAWEEYLVGGPGALGGGQ